MRKFIILLLLPLNCFANEPIQNYKIKADETLYDIARKFDLGVSELVLANPQVDPWIPQVGTNIILPTAHLLPDSPKIGIVINIAEARLYYFPKTGVAKTFPVSIGMEDSKTPLGKTKIIKKRKNPIWIPPESIKAKNPNLPVMVPPGESNPLGQYAMNLESTESFKWPRITIHGTNTPWSIGVPASHGCLRLYPEDIEVLFNEVPVGTAVTIINQPIKVGIINRKLYIEAYPDNAGTSNLLELIQKHERNESYNLNWEAVEKAVKESNGVPVEISY